MNSNYERYDVNLFDIGREESLHARKLQITQDNQRHDNKRCEHQTHKK